MAQFPSSIISFSTKVNGQIIDASDINSPQSEITALETKVGVDNSAVVTSLDYLIKSSVSSGGGHVQSANTGGTGQTTYTKGDILVATSQSVLSKLSIGLDTQALVVNSSTASGFQYQGVATAQTIQNQTNTYAPASVVSASVYSITFPNIVSVLSAGQAFAVKWPTTPAGSVLALQVSSLVAQRIVMPDLTNPPVGLIRSSMISVVENDGTNWQIQNTPPVTTTVAGLVPTPPNNTTTFLRGDGTFASVLGFAITYKNGGTTKDASDASTTQNIAHGLGTTPKKVRIVAVAAGGSTGYSTMFAETVYNGTTQSSASRHTTGANVQISSNFVLNNSTTSTDTQTGAVAFDATNIVITWTKSGNPTGSYTLLWEAEA